MTDLLVAYGLRYVCVHPRCGAYITREERGECARCHVRRCYLLPWWKVAA